MNGHGDSDVRLWVQGSPSGGENPPHERPWRRAVAEAAAGLDSCAHVELGFVMEPGRVRIDLDNLVRPALGGLRDAGVLSRGLVGLTTIVAGKNAGQPAGLSIRLVKAALSYAERPLIIGRVDLDIEHDRLPRADHPAEKHAWRETVRQAGPFAPSQGPVSVDIAIRSSSSLGEMLKPVIDGLEPYLGRARRGRGDFRPLDERVVTLRAWRVLELPMALHVQAGTPIPADRGLA